MTWNTETVYTELRPYFQERVRRNEPLARHSAFGVGGPADVWVSLEAKQELIDLVRLCAEGHYPLLIAGNGTNVLYADAGVRGMVAHIALSSYQIEDQGDGSALLLADAGVSWPRLLHELTPVGWGGLEFGVGIPGTLGGGVISNAGAHNDDLGQVLQWIEVLDARGCNAAGEDQLAVPVVRRYQHDELDLGYRHSRFREQRQVRFDERGQFILPPRGMIEPAEIIMLLGIRLHREDPQQAACHHCPVYTASQADRASTAPRRLSLQGSTRRGSKPSHRPGRSEGKKQRQSTNLAAECQLYRQSGRSTSH